MSSMLESLMGQLGGDTLKNLSSQIGADEKQTQSALTAAVPLLMGALSLNAQKGDGAQSLDRALEKDHDGGILDNISGFLGQGDTSMGAGILGHVLGGKQTRVQQGISQSSGLSSEASGKLLAMVAPLVMGALGKAKRSGSLDASGIAGLLGSEQQNVQSKLPESMGMLGALLDSDGDGDVDLGDIMGGKGGGLLGKLFGKNN
jgi:hypothetical protein